MKKLLSLILALMLLLSACGGAPAETTEPETTEPETTVPATTVPETTEPETTEPPVVYFNPLNGEILQEPYTGRVFAVTINNVAPALPFQGVSQADMFFEMLVNDSATRCLALFTNIVNVPSVGSIRSNRLNFNDIAVAYDAVLTHAGGSDLVLGNMNERGIDALRAESTVAGFRDQNRRNSGYAWEHCLFATGQQMHDAAVKQEYDVTQPADKNYGLVFAEDGTPEGGEDATKLTVYFWSKKTVLEYDLESGKYNYYEFGEYVTDENNDQPIAFNNVIIMKAEVNNVPYQKAVYHVAQVQGSGDGYFACNGKIVPIKWIHENETDPFTFTLEDGTPLVLNQGNTYVAFAPVESEFTYEGSAEVVETETN